MKKLKSDRDGDRLSVLPDSLILEILSLLEMRDVVRTTLVSKRWKDLWVTTPCLKFRCSGNDDFVKKRSFVYRTLTLWRGIRLRQFSIDFCTDSESEASLSMDIPLWVQFATERKVEDLCIFFRCGGFSFSCLCPPHCLYECSSIRKLSLLRCNLRIRGNVKWDRLNTLNLSNCVFDEDAMNQVFSSSPQLETFTVCWDKPRLQKWSIRSSTLKNLGMECRYFKDNPYVQTIWAPNLRVLKYSGTPCVSLLTDISSLTEVYLDFSHDVEVNETLSRILPLIRHVVSVELSVSCIKVFRGNYSISPLLNVKLLTIVCWEVELSDIVGLLQSFPKLKMLVVKWLSAGEEFQFDAENYSESGTNILNSNLLQMRTVVITWYAWEASFFVFIEFMLEHAAMIEKMVIRTKGMINSEEMLQAAKKLISLQRSFPSVELILC